MNYKRKTINEKRTSSPSARRQAPGVLRSALCALLLALCAVPVLADDKPLEITARVDRDAVNIGDRIKLELAAANRAGYEVWFPDKPEDLGDFVLYASSPVERRGGPKQAHEYVLGVYSTGTHVIPPVTVRYRSEGGEWLTAKSRQVPIEVESLLAPGDSDIRGLKGVVSLSTGAVWRSLLITLAVALVALGIYVKRNSRLPWAGTEDKKVRPAHEVAFEELSKLKEMGLPLKGRMREYYFRLSDIIRHYVESRFSLRAPEMTTEEFLEKAKAAAELRDDHKTLLKGFLSACDMVKFAKYGPTPLEAADSFKSAEKFVDETKQAEEGRSE